MALRTYAKQAADILRQSGETDSGYYTLAEARGYTMYKLIQGYCTWLYKAQNSDGSSPVTTSTVFYYIDFLASYKTKRHKFI